MSEKLKYENTRLAIDLRDEIREVYREVLELPREYVELFLSVLNTDPKIDASEIRAVVFQKYESVSAPYASKDLNEAYLKILPYGTEAISRFKHAVELLGENIDSEKLVDKILNDLPATGKGEKDNSIFGRIGVRDANEAIEKLGIIRKYDKVERKWTYRLGKRTFPSVEEAVLFHCDQRSDERVIPNEHIIFEEEPASPTPTTQESGSRYVWAWMVWVFVNRSIITVSGAVISVSSSLDILLLVDAAVTFLAAISSFWLTYRIFFTGLILKKVLPWAYFLTAFGTIISVISIDNDLGAMGFATNTYQATLWVSSILSWIASMFAIRALALRADRSIQ